MCSRACRTCFSAKTSSLPPKSLRVQDQVDAGGEAEQQARVHARHLYEKLLQLEESVQLYRHLHEEEEHAQYVDAIAELQEVYAQLEAVREAQGCCLTPWVRRLRTRRPALPQIANKRSLFA